MLDCMLLCMLRQSINATAPLAPEFPWRKCYVCHRSCQSCCFCSPPEGAPAAATGLLSLLMPAARCPLPLTSPPQERWPTAREQELRNYLGSFGIRGGVATQPLPTLSGGRPGAACGSQRAGLFVGGHDDSA